MHNTYQKSQRAAARSSARRMRIGRIGLPLAVLLLFACAAEETDDASQDEEAAADTGAEELAERIDSDPVVDGDGMYEFIYVPPENAPEIETIFVPGSFNGWDNTSHEMEEDSDGVWRVRAELEPNARHEYKFYFHADDEDFSGGGWVQDMSQDSLFGHPEHDDQVDPTASGSTDDGQGGQNAYVDVASETADEDGLGYRHDPEDPAHVSIADGRLSIRAHTNEGSAEAASVISGESEYEMSHQLSFRGNDVYRATLPEDTEEYTIRTTDSDGEQEDHGPYTVPDTPFASLDWVGDSVGYQIFPDRFYNGDPSIDERALETDSVNYKHPDHWTWSGDPIVYDGWEADIDDRHCCHAYFGGDFAGVMEKLDHLEALGVSMIYFNPIFESGSVHGYDAHDFMELAPNFGDEETLKQLLDEAHERDIRVIWDFVPNHVGTGHWAFQEAIADGGHETEYWDWFRFRVDPGDEIMAGFSEHYDSWSDLGNLPELETRNEDVFDHLIDVAEYWTEFGFDGVRVDVPNDLENPDEFFPEMREAVRDINPEAYIVGEIWQRAPSWIQGDQFDSLMNYAVGRGMVQEFAGGEMSASDAIAEMQLLYASYPEASTAMAFNIISSHDTARLLTRLGADGLGGEASDRHHAQGRLSKAILYALPGMPVTYQGDEFGMLGSGEGPREENRYPVQWDDPNEETLEHYELLGELKNSIEALDSGAISDFEADGDVIRFTRGDSDSGRMIGVFNSGDSAAEDIELPEGAWRDEVTDEVFEDSVEVDAYGWRYLTAE
ncbi:MAG: alpha-amylase family glycosyl hydrolase [Spirochaetales bacterium]